MIKHFSHYSTYKPSGVEWLGDVPTHWEVRRLKGHVTNIADQTNELGPNEIYLALENIESWTGKFLQNGNMASFDSQVKRFQIGDVLFGKLRPYLAKVTSPNRNGVCVGEFLVLRCRDGNLLSSFLERLLRSKPAIDTIDASTFGAKMPRADWQFIGSMMFPLPPLPEQRTIVRYLDHVDRRIQLYIEAKEQLIALLQEARQAITRRAVTRGLDPDVPLKPSGVEWLGDVPAHWEVTATKRHYAIQLGKMLQSVPKRPEDVEVPYLKALHVQWFDVLTSDVPTMWASHYETRLLGIAPGDLLVCEGGEGGRCAILTDQIDNCIIEKALHRVRPREQSLNVYLQYVMSTVAAIGWFDVINNKATIAHFTREKFDALRIPVPPLAEQRAVAAHLDQATATIDAAIDTARRQVESMLEYRASLIAHVVTGKLDVRAAVNLLQEAPEQESPIR